MNAPKAILFLGLYLLALAHPVIPFIEYQVNKAYIAANLCENKDRPEMMCNGACHLKKQIQKQATQDQDLPGPLIDTEKFFEAVPQSPATSLLTKRVPPQFARMASDLSSSFSQKIFHPPLA